MSDIEQISELREKDGGDWHEWPFPTVTIVSRVTGDLKARILALTDCEGEVLIEECEVSGGYSEYTQEDEHSIRVLIEGVERWKAEYEFSQDGAMAKFMKWVTQVPTPSPGLPAV